MLATNVFHSNHMKLCEPKQNLTTTLTNFGRKTKQLCKYFLHFLPWYYQNHGGSNVTDSCKSKNHDIGAFFPETARLTHFVLRYPPTSVTCISWAITKLCLSFPSRCICDRKTAKALGTSKLQTLRKQNGVGSILSKGTDWPNLTPRWVTWQNIRERCSYYSNQGTFKTLAWRFNP